MTADETDDTRILIRVALYSFLINPGLVIIKLTLSFSTGSLSLAADAVHSFIDIIGSGALILGLIISRRKSSSFPYGLYKVENLVAVIISLLLFGTAYGIVHQALFSASEIHEFSAWVLVLVAALILVPFLFGLRNPYGYAIQFSRSYCRREKLHCRCARFNRCVFWSFRAVYSVAC